MTANLISEGWAMQTPLTVTFRDIPRSAAVEAHARDLAARLQRIEEHIAQCRMNLEGSASSDSPASTYLCKIELTVPGARIHADSLRPDGSGHDNLYHAMRDAYENAKLQLRKLLHSRPRYQ